MKIKADQIKTHNGFRYIERNGLRLFILDGMSREDWLRLRQMDGALGGSDVGTIMGWNYHFSKIELFYQKIGLNFEAKESQNEYTYWGSTNERNIMDTAQYYDFNDPQAYIFNKASGNKIRRITELKFSVRNPSIPYMNANVDGLIDFAARSFKARRIAESKTITRQSAEMWETIPPYHLGQIMMYMHVLSPMLKEQYAEIYYLQDGNKFTGWEIPQNQNLLEILTTECEKFYKKVVEGIEIVSNVFDPDTRSKYLGSIEPDPDDTKGYEQFQKEALLRKKSFVKIRGDQHIQNVAEKFTERDKEAKALDKEIQLYKNQIMKVLNDSSANIIELDEGGKITFNKRLYVRTNSK